MVISKVYSDARRSRRVCKKMKRLLNVLGALVSDLTQNELAARGACRCHKFRSGGFGMELHTYGQALWNAKNATGGNACVAVSGNGSGIRTRLYLICRATSPVRSTS